MIWLLFNQCFIFSDVRMSFLSLMRKGLAFSVVSYSSHFGIPESWYKKASKALKLAFVLCFLSYVFPRVPHVSLISKKEALFLYLIQTRFSYIGFRFNSSKPFEELSGPTIPITKYIQNLKVGFLSEYSIDKEEL